VQSGLDGVAEAIAPLPSGVMASFNVDSPLNTTGEWYPGEAAGGHRREWYPVMRPTVVSCSGIR
jgi:hypothetical protein